MKRYNKTKIVGVIFVILFALLIAYTFKYVSEIREKQLAVLAEGEILRAEFDFFASECLQDYDEDTIFGIYDSKWINEKMYEINVRILLTCEDKLIGGSYGYNNSTNIYTLKYTVLRNEKTPVCMCVYELTYRLSLSSKEFDVDYQQIDVSEW